MQPELAIFIIPGLVVIFLLGIFMQYLKSKDIQAMELRPAVNMTNLFLIIIILIFYLFLAMFIISSYMVS
jgi:hypothetical protein